MNKTSTTSPNELSLEFVGVGVVDFPVYSNEDYWQREVPYAIFILIFCTFFIILQFLVMRVMITDKDLKKLSAFQIMFMISFFDTIQLFIHLTAVFYILNSKPHFDFPDYLIGAVMNASWVSMLILSIFLNINRLISIVFHFQSNKIFNSFNMKIYFTIVLIVWCIVCFLNAFGFSRMVYLLPAYTWHYAASNPLSAVLRSVSADISLIDVVFSLFAHLVIFSYIYFKAALLSKKELILTIQVLCVSIFHVIGYLTWEYLPIPWELPIGVFIGHVVWMIWNSINSMLYVLINPRIRNLVLASIGKQTEVSGRTMFVASHVSTVRQSGAKM
ncbi:Serpentine Receptor, class T [Caenorhabditis elegans]|uniref:Serpentine Receptor, class T n=1 Tax=Caenorhabditis elegans TaxID=6239 RepID=Q22246_CAEEL|nr:Serpentine Receptor, class T [Caenorhabditis elegans]CCD63309.1 Serpentine Receptor, class T [Caenorhabditis elegans]|eukprot:NP_501310.2 Serpentine Receptor, class T [Caenorhabditis elegans]